MLLSFCFFISELLILFLSWNFNGVIIMIRQQVQQEYISIYL